MIALLLAGLIAAHPHARAHAGPITFSDHGETVKIMSLPQLRALVPPETVRVLEPHEEAEVRFEAMPLPVVLDRVYGGAWRQAEAVLFICADGFRKPIPRAEITEAPFWLAVARVGDPGFSITEKEPVPKKITVGPLFLIRRGGTKEDWPFQIVALDLIKLADKFPGLTPPKDASAAAMRGHGAFVKYCVSCHALGGEGGKVGPELNAPVSVTTYYKEPWLKKWIAKPSALRAGTAMPAVIPPGKGQGKTIDDIVEYLKAMAPRP